MRSTRSSKEVKKHVNLLELLEADPPDFYIKKVNEETGYGVFSRCVLDKGDPLFLYRGNCSTGNLDHVQDDSYIFEFGHKGTTYCIDASVDDGSLGRMVNDEQRTPNCLPKVTEIMGQPYVVFFALRTIHPGDEVRYNYGPGNYPWRKKNRRLAECKGEKFRKSNLHNEETKNDPMDENGLEPEERNNDELFDHIPRIDTYKKRSIGINETDLSLRKELTEMEKYLVSSQELMELRGKTGTKVPVILPPEVKRHLQYLADGSVRSTAGISENNKYLFASSGKEPVRAGNALDIVKYEADLKYPNRICATNLRKHTATISQVIGLKDHELKWLLKHMGHTEKVHMTHYRATSGLIERLDIAKIMLLQEKNNVGRFAGVELPDIQFQDLDGEAENGATENDGAVTEGMQPVPELGDELSFLADSVEEEQVSPSAGKMKGKRVVRVPWNETEMEEIQMYFKDYIELKTNKKCPGMKDCILAINKSKAANGEIWKRSWETIKKKVSHLIVAKRKNLE